MTKSAAELNPPLSPWVRVLTGIVLLFLFNGSTLLLAPSLTIPRWPWAIPPFNASFLGAIYIAEAASVLVLFFINRWSPGRAGLFAASIFTTVASAGTLLHLDLFLSSKRAALWFGLYIGYVVLPLLALWIYRNLPRPPPLPISQGWRTLLRASGGAMVAYGLALFALPETVTAFWPWHVDHMHGQIYSGIFLAGGAGLLLIARDGACEEFLTLGLASLMLGIFAIVGLISTGMATNRLDWSGAGTWVWIAIFAGFAALGAGITAKAARA